MENAAKALYIAAGVLIAIMVLSLGAVLYASLQGYINSTNQQIRFNEVNGFNAKFMDYLDRDLNIQDVITVANIAYENNSSYNTDVNQWDASANSLYVQVLLDGNRIDKNINENMVSMLEENKDKVFICQTVSYSSPTSRVCSVSFKTK